MFELMVTFTYWASCRVINGCVLRTQTAHLQVQCLLGIVSEDGESALHGIFRVGATAIIAN